jgi:hypothetical protein
MCLEQAWNDASFVSEIVPILSQKSVVGSFWGIPRQANKLQSQRASLAQWFVAIYSASHKEAVTVCCFFRAPRKDSPSKGEKVAGDRPTSVGIVCPVCVRIARKEDRLSVSENETVIACALEIAYYTLCGLPVLPSGVRRVLA